MLLSRIVSLLKFSAFRSPASEMSCGDCDRVNSCGLPPHTDCEEKLVQAAMAERYNLANRRRLVVPRNVDS